MTLIPENVQCIIRAIQSAGYRAWCVGGCVRDSLLGRLPQDWDIAATARPEQLMAMFGADAVPTGLPHGTVTVVNHGGPVEVTTLRRDGEYRDNRHPLDVTFTESLEEDLARRDFTINAMAMDLSGEITDPFGGREDLRLGLLRCVGDGDRRMKEDALRIMRGLRFASTLQLRTEERTERALRENRMLLRHIAVERIQDELMKLLSGGSVTDILLAYSDILGVVIPEILPAVGFDQRNPHHCYTIWEHTARAVGFAPADPILRCTLLFHDLGKPDTFSLDEEGTGHFYAHGRRSAQLAEEICRRLRMDNLTRETIVLLVGMHDVEIPMTEKSIRRMLRRIGEENLRRLLQVKRADNLAQHPDYRYRQEGITQLETLLNLVLQQEQCFSLRHLAVKGNDLTALGLQGKDVGDMLNTLLDLVVEEKLPNDRGILLSYVKEEMA